MSTLTNAERRRLAESDDLGVRKLLARLAEAELLIAETEAGCYGESPWRLRLAAFIKDRAP